MATWESSTLSVVQSSGEMIDRQYDWTYGNRTISYEMGLPREFYELQKRRHRIYDYGAYVADRFTQDFFSDLADELESIGNANRYSRREVVELATRFVQSLPYTVDTVSTGYSNYPRYPIETLVDETGDCEDSSLLLTAILDALGYRVGLLEFDSHLGVGVEVGGVSGNFEIGGVEYSYIEPTDSGWEVGELPSRLAGRSFTFHQVDDSPVLYSAWQGKIRGKTFACDGLVRNQGQGCARNVVFQLFLNDSQGETVTAVEQEWRSIEPGSQVRWTDEVYVEPDSPVTPEWIIGVEGTVHDRGEGERQRT